VNETRTADAVDSPLDEKRPENFCWPVAALNAVLGRMGPLLGLLGVRGFGLKSHVLAVYRRVPRELRHACNSSAGLRWTVAGS
jgi:hypothetical protein